MKPEDTGIEFIEQPEEEEGSTSALQSLKDIDWGRCVTKNLLFIVWLTMLGMVYIANRYHSERIARQTVALKAEVNELRAESITTANQLMYLSRQSVVSSLAKEKGLTVEEAVKPPYVLKK